MSSAPKKSRNVDDGNDSEAELEGMDLEGDDEHPDTNDAPMVTVDVDESKSDDEDLANIDHETMEQARKERRELAKLTSSKEDKEPNSVQGKLEYLLEQSDVFAHFLAGSVAVDEKKSKKKGSRGKTGRLTEAAEDAAMLKSAESKRRGVVRLDKQPRSLSETCKMRPYQLEGLNWLIKLHDHGVNGILADEMGLGKTLQTISLLAYLRESRGVRGPHIIIVPKSVVGNWMKEISKWCPRIRDVRMGGTKDERRRFTETALEKRKGQTFLKYDVLVTSYEGLCKEKGRFSKIQWEYVIIDEAHRIKNEKSSLSVAVRDIPTQARLLITGTPLQNNLREQFDQWFSLSDESGKENVIKRLHTVLRPFMLRRVKKDVASDLPPKKETKLFIGMTKMQQEWYVRCLQKDASELNKLGGPDRSRLLNVLMQLRKVCNHPYLFDGAETGPPYVDGPHLWENAGKTKLLDKLLPKLQNQGDRVLIFCQMTRVLDILEDYCRLKDYEYCRIDGNTDGDRRDAQMEEYNAEGSSKFVFLLSTRAGGLGINLATANIVVLYDSDWNPQADLQAMDRAHRIGQKKPVQVFRFITQGTVEEKIIERADRKLFLDAAVIQQGRLAEQNNSLEKGELMKMVQFGADQILSGTGGTYTDEEIDALIAKGEEKTEALDTKLKSAKHNLANFSLLDDDETGRDTFSFGGKNYRSTEGVKGNFINLPQRQRKRSYDLQAGPESRPGMKAHAADVAAKRKRKSPAIHDFQLFDTESLNELHKKEKELATRKSDHIKIIEDIRKNAAAATSHVEEQLKRASAMEQELGEIRLSDEEEATKQRLQEEGFPDWSRKDFRCFCNSLEKHGRYNFASLLHDMKNDTGKDGPEIQRYFLAFWANYQRITDWERIIAKIESGEKRILRFRKIADNIQEFVERHLETVYGPVFYGRPSHSLPSLEEMLHHSWSNMKINYWGARGKGYKDDEDAFLICMMYRHGFGAVERIRMEIRRAWQFRFDWFFKSRSAHDIHKRCETLVRIIEKENEKCAEEEINVAE